jgi:hypothetical protein
MTGVGGYFERGGDKLRLNFYIDLNMILSTEFFVKCYIYALLFIPFLFLRNEWTAYIMCCVWLRSVSVWTWELGNWGPVCVGYLHFEMLEKWRQLKIHSSVGRGVCNVRRFLFLIFVPFLHFDVKVIQTAAPGGRGVRDVSHNRYAGFCGATPELGWQTANCFSLTLIK